MLKEGTSRNLRWENARYKNEKKINPQPVVVDSEGELEGYVPVPKFSQSFSDAIAVALEKASLNQGIVLMRIAYKFRFSFQF